MNSKEKKIDVKKIREEVKKTYAEAISRKNLSCCGNFGGTCCSAKTKDIGYSDEELNNLPADSAITSFGCGNPLAYSEVREGDVVLDLGPGAGLDLLIARILSHCSELYSTLLPFRNDVTQSVNEININHI